MVNTVKVNLGNLKDNFIVLNWIADGTVVCNYKGTDSVRAESLIVITSNIRDGIVLTHKSAAMVAKLENNGIRVNFYGRENIHRLDFFVPLNQIPREWRNDKYLVNNWKAILQYFCLGPCFKMIVKQKNRVRKYFIRIIERLTPIPITNTFPISRNVNIFLDGKGVVLRRGMTPILKVSCLERLSPNILDFNKVF